MSFLSAAAPAEEASEVGEREMSEAQRWRGESGNRREKAEKKRMRGEFRAVDFL